MKQLNQLPEIANEMLGGITAGPELLTRIVTAPPRKRRAPLFVRRVAALALSAAMVLGLALGLPTLLYRDDQAIITQAAGNLPAGGRTRALDVPRGSIKLVNTGTARAIRAYGHRVRALISRWCACRAGITAC